jgi:hypothetical protein
MARPDAALALSALYALEMKRECKVGSVCVAGSGFSAAVFCDIVARLYTGPARNGNDALAVGFATQNPPAPDPAMVKPVIERKKENGDLQYSRSVSRLGDTSLAESVLRNGVIFNAESVMVLSAPATGLAKSIDLLGTKDMYKQRVKRFVIVDTGSPQKDPAAVRKVFAEWPGPVFYSGPDVGAALMFPGARLDMAFSWTEAHPVADAYRAFKTMPYDAPLHDLAALHYAVHPDSGFFKLSDPGGLTVDDSGIVKFAPGSGNVRRLTVETDKKAAALDAVVAIAAAALPNRSRNATP